MQKGVGIGFDENPFSMLDVHGGVSIGLYAFSNAAPNNGMIISGNVGIGTTNPVSKLDINGGLSLGSYAGVNAAPTNGMIISGNVGIGTSTPESILEIFSTNADSWTEGLLLHSALPGDPPDLLKTYLKQRSDGFYIRSYGGYNFMDAAGTTNLMNINSSGNVGIGTTNPTEKLELNGGFFINSDVVANDMLKIATLATGNVSLVDAGIRFSDSDETYWSGNFSLKSKDGGSPSVKRIMLDALGTSYINTDGLAIGKTTLSSGYKLDVNGKIRANEIVVNTTGADFVFDDTYELKTLSEVEDYINTNGHLPDIQPADKLVENGMQVGEMQTLLLQKIEELTLYIIDQEKRIKELEEKN